MASIMFRPLEAACRGIVLVTTLVVSMPTCAETREIEATAYCKCGECNGYSRGNWKLLKLDFWNRYVSEGPESGQRYTGKTASGGRLRQPNPGLISTDSLKRPYMIPVRIVFPWLAIPRPGTIAADTRYYPFGTKMYVPAYGWGIVGDRGGAIKGPDRIDLLYNSHARANEWGRQRVQVKIVR